MFVGSLPDGSWTVTSMVSPGVRPVTSNPRSPATGSYPGGNDPEGIGEAEIPVRAVPFGLVMATTPATEPAELT